MAIVNCLGLTAPKLKEIVKENTEKLVATNLISSSTNSETGACDNLCGNLLLEFFKEFALFVALNELRKITIADNSNSSYDPSKLFSSLKDSLSVYKDQFSNLLGAGKGSSLSNMVGLYGDGSKFPNESVLGENGTKNILDILNANDYYSKNNTGKNPLDSLNSLVVPDGANDGLVKDNLFSGDPNSFIKKIPNSDLEGIDLNTDFFKCFKPKFNFNNYVLKHRGFRSAIVTPEKIKNLERLHTEVLTPFYDYFFPAIDDSACAMQVVFGLTSSETVRRSIYGSIVSKHITGECADILLNGVSTSTIVEAILSKKLVIPFGVITATNGLHITLPYVFNGYEVKGLIIQAPRNNDSYITTTFV